MKSTKAQVMKDVVFQSLLLIIVFIAVGYEKHDPNISGSKLAFFGTYALTALFIGYVLSPRFFYTKRSMLYDCKSGLESIV
jgi:hypothetical protein